LDFTVIGKKILRWLFSWGLTIGGGVGAVFTARWLIPALGLPSFVFEGRNGPTSLTELVLIGLLLTAYLFAVPKLLRLSVGEFMNMLSGK